MVEHRIKAILKILDIFIPCIIVKHKPDELVFVASKLTNSVSGLLTISLTF